MSWADQVPTAYIWVQFLSDGFVVLNQGVPSPKLQFHAVGSLIDVSLNWTFNGAGPGVDVLVKDAVGAGGAVMVNFLSLLLEWLSLFVTITSHAPVIAPVIGRVQVI